MGIGYILLHMQSLDPQTQVPCVEMELIVLVRTIGEHAHITGAFQSGYINMKINKIVIISILVIVLIVIGLLSDRQTLIKKQNEAKEISIAESNNSTEGELATLTSNSSYDTVNVTLSMLSALSYFYLTDEKDITKADDNLVSINSNLMEQNRYLKAGIDEISNLGEHKDDVVELSYKGTILGASQIMKANNDLLEFFRTVDQSDPKLEQEASYRLAEYSSSVKEGYKNIFIYAPQIVSLYWKPAENDNPTGPIPYTLSKEDRARLLKDIDNLFADYIKQDDQNYITTKTHNAILLAVKQIRDNLKPDNYEDIEE